MFFEPPARIFIRKAYSLGFMAGPTRRALPYAVIRKAFGLVLRKAESLTDTSVEQRPTERCPQNVKPCKGRIGGGCRPYRAWFLLRLYVGRCPSPTSRACAGGVPSLVDVALSGQRQTRRIRAESPESPSVGQRPTLRSSPVLPGKGGILGDAPLAGHIFVRRDVGRCPALICVRPSVYKEMPLRKKRELELKKSPCSLCVLRDLCGKRKGSYV